MQFYYHEADSELLIVAADGGLNRQTSDDFVTSLEQLIDSGIRKIIVDCEHLTYVSSYGLSVLVRLHHRLKDKGGDVKLAAVHHLIVQLLETTRLSEVFSLYPDVERARLAFRPPDETA